MAPAGHSYGALFALKAALARPARIRGLVLEDPARPVELHPPPDQLEEFVHHNEAFLDAMRTPEAEIRSHAGRDGVERSRDRGLGGVQDPGRPAPPPPPPPRPRRWRDLIGSVGRPTLLVVPRGEGAGVRTANPAVTIVRIPRVGHCIRRDDPAAYFGVVDPFLGSLA